MPCKLSKNIFNSEVKKMLGSAMRVKGVRTFSEMICAALFCYVCRVNGSQEVVYPPDTRRCCYHLPGFSWITLVLIEIVMMKSCKSRKFDCCLP